MPIPPVELRNLAGRARLLATARLLFTRHGASNVGINDVTAAAGVARMTLYNNFPSKDALIEAVYQEIVGTELEELGKVTSHSQSDEQAVLAIFDHFDRGCLDTDYRGCPLIHASMQMYDGSGSVYEIVHRYKRGLREHVFAVLDDVRVNRADLADQILMLLDGAVTEAYLRGATAPVAAAKRAASILLRAKP